MNNDRGWMTNIQCPCSKCRHIGGFWDAETVKLHLLKNGFVSDYYVWSRHGESYISGQSGEQSSPYYSNTQDRTDEDNLMYNMVMDAVGPSFDPEMPNAETKKLYDILKSSKKKLYEGCETCRPYSSWPIIVTPYNLPLWMWTIIDFPDYSMLSGWKTGGHLACPHCAHDHDAYNLSHGGKTTWFDNHRKFLPANHPFRKNKNWFTKGKTVTESPPPVRTGEDVYHEIESLGLMKVTELGSDEHNARPMSEAKFVQPASRDNKGIGEKAVGFAQFASPKKHNGGASVDINGFAKIVSKKKHSQSANVGLAPNTQVPDQRMSKARSLQVASPDAEVRMRRFRSHVENVPAQLFLNKAYQTILGMEETNENKQDPNKQKQTINQAEQTGAN
ncbi:hypothetical protein POM88_029372 [Heracleum sosnowskyi]|uniref:Transposase-associated domain-containing protein n=1 Tax=Heracleum sosnowskyi TaxID=360622 RepID=A0AAD8HTI5_9APIA|nr:hypothetical protein POM88_029372 [Heracleum sosnowskyi]